jgi:flavin reductase (DIM6/NTAB) family NADH-FMN oxidoreductase RutF/rubredoxin
MDSNITHNITHGLYVLTTNGGGCIVDAVSRVGGTDYPLIAVAVNKNNYTNELLKKNKTFALSVLPKNTNGDLIKTFGMHSARDYDKFKDTPYMDIDNIKVIKDSIGYMICEITNNIDTETHNLFIGKLLKANKFNDEEELTYNYFSKHKDEYLKTKVDNKTAWICTVCGYIYYGEELPPDYKCPICGAGPEFFKKQI